MEVLDVPTPVLGPGMILVRNHFSLISAGTEGSTVTAARKSLLGKARERPQQVMQVLDVLLQQGPVQTYRAVMKKLDAWSPLGYSCAGRVVCIAPDVSAFSVGDLVACGGLSASHAEVVAVPVHLCVKLQPAANLKKAAYNTLGAIALQGVRLADLRLGETCAVIGLGLIGQLTCLLLKASGVRVIGIDVDDRMVGIAARCCADLAVARGEAGIAERIETFSGGVGVDAVIVAAGSDSLDPVNFAGRICRKKGRVVIVGNVPTGFDRDPHYYRKELELRMSCSYGPGRYDPLYEEKGIDYPIGYVRWTEQRNMAAFQELIHSEHIDVSPLTTHEFSLEEAPQAYDLILKKGEPCLGILICYDTTREHEAEKIVLRRGGPTDKVGIAFIGAGSYAQSHLLPNLPHDSSVTRVGVMTSTGTSARSVAERFEFGFCTSDEREILADSAVNTVFIATRHDSHADYVLKALAAGKHVFVEKPLCLSEEELEGICEAYRGGHSQLLVGFNRRFSPLARQLKERLRPGPMAMIYRINAGKIPADSWIQDPERGGGRIVGEVCHFVDFLTFLNGSLPVEVFATALPDALNLQDTVAVQLRFANGSVGTISYLSNGSKAVPKEHIEIYKDGQTGILRDFRELAVYSTGRPFREKHWSQDKGQKEMVLSFIETVQEGKPSPIAFGEIEAVTLATFKILESLRTRNVVRLNP